MTMAVMQIGIMRMSMYEGRVSVPVAVRLARGLVRPMPVLVMLVMNMLVFVLHCFVGVLVVVSLRQVQPESEPHEESGE
jgi:hypothetical protein